MRKLGFTVPGGGTGDRNTLPLRPRPDTFPRRGRQVYLVRRLRGLGSEAIGGGTNDRNTLPLRPPVRQAYRFPRPWRRGLGFEDINGGTTDRNTQPLLPPNNLTPGNVLPVDPRVTPGGPMTILPFPNGGNPGIAPGIPNNGFLPPGAGWQQVEAPGNPFPYVYIGTGGQQQPPRYQPGSTPPGSYQQTSRNISVQGDTLFAECQDRNGVWHASSLPGVSACVNSGGEITNINGQLQCVGGQQQPIYYPSPMYGATYPSTSAVNVPMANGQVMNPTRFSSFSPSVGSQVSDFFAQNKTLILGLGAALFLGPPILRALQGGHR